MGEKAKSCTKNVKIIKLMLHPIMHFVVGAALWVGVAMQKQLNPSTMHLRVPAAGHR